MGQMSAVDEFLTAVETATIAGCDTWSADAVLDATVPNWRLQASDPDAIRAEYGRWFAGLLQPADRGGRIRAARGGGNVHRYLELSPWLAEAEAAIGSQHLVPQLVGKGWQLPA